MKNILLVILAAMVLGAVLPGCHHEPRYDSRLTAADSLMQKHPDSALAILKALSPNSSSPARGEVARSDGGGGVEFSNADKAYHALLLTQARYKCYVTATSDSNINLALAYFRTHPADREKLTRAYIYKGAVMDELGHPDSAMFYYKTAEANAAPDDYFNLGYSKMRIATLYQDQLSNDNEAVNNLKQAIRYFTIINDTIYLISCYGNLGGINGLKNPDSTEFYLKKAITLAQAFDPCLQYTYKSKLAGCYYYLNDYQRSKDLAMDVFHNGKDFSEETQFYYYAAWSYLKMGLLDSAKYIFSATPLPLDAVDSMNRFDVTAEIAKAESNAMEYSNAMLQSRDIRIQIESTRSDSLLKKAESNYHIAQVQKKEKEMTTNYYLSIAISGVLLLLVAIIVVKAIRRFYLFKKLEEEKNAIEQELAHLRELQKQHTLDKHNVSTLVGYRIDVLNELFDSIRFKVKKADDRKGRSIIFLSSIVKGLSNDYVPMKVDLSDEFWDRMKKSVDGEFRGIASYVEKKYPALTDKELKLFYMLCAKISPQIIKICLNFTNWKSVTNNRTILIKKKMGYNYSLEEFIDRYMKGML